MTKTRYKLNEMELKAKKIKKIQFISNTILANACYHTKEMENQIGMAQKTGNLTKEEEEIVCNAWNMRNRLARELMQEFKEYMKEK